MLQIIVRVFSISVLCLLTLHCSQRSYPDTPEEVLDNYYKALAAGNFSLAGDYLSATDQELFKTEYKSDDIYPKIVEKTWSLSKWKFDKSSITGHKAKVVVSIEMPNVGEIFGNITGEVLGRSEDANISSSQLQRKALLQLENKRFSYIFFNREENLIYENNKWKILADIAKKEKIKQLIMASIRLIRERKLDEALLKLNQIYAIDRENKTATYLIKSLEDLSKKKGNQEKD